MGGRRDKGLGLARYLTGHAGIPLLTWNPADGRIDAPYPYQIDVATERKLETWHDLLRVERDPNTISMSILYNYGMDSMDQAWVGMHLRPFTTLLATHYNTHIAHRGEHA